MSVRPARAVRPAHLVLLALGAGALLSGCGQGSVAGDPAATTSSTASSPAGGGADEPSGGTAGWRTEYWLGLQVQVPADWTWGSAPLDPVEGSVLSDGAVCGDVPDAPYVGRPILASDLCLSGFDRRPGTDSVWLGVDLELGTDDLGGGYVRETVAVAGTTLTVTTDDAGLRARILATAAPQTLCPAAVAEPPRVDAILTEGMGDARSLTVCAYRPDGRATTLAYAAVLGADAAAAFQAAIAVGPAADPTACPAFARREYVSLVVTGDDPYGDVPVTQEYAVDLGCGTVETAPGATQRLTRDAVLPWAVGGIPVTLVGPPVRGLADHFIGVMG